MVVCRLKEVLECECTVGKEQFLREMGYLSPIFLSDSMDNG